MSAEAIAKVCADLWAGRIQDPAPGVLTPRLLELMASAPVIDSTRLYESIIEDGSGRNVYDDHRIAPPWQSALIGYLNRHGNVHVCHVAVATLTNTGRREVLADYLEGQWTSDSGTHEIDWFRVAWIYTVSVFIGGRNGRGEAVPTSGPVHLWRVAVYADGEIADFRWVHLRPEIEMDTWDMASLVWLGTINFLNCRNVTMVEPIRPRAMARRVARTGVRVHELSVTPMGRSSRREPGAPAEPLALPLHSVRGHFSEYGVNGKGLLFGKLAGRYWIPQHARGSADVGLVDQRFTIRP